MWHFVFIYQLLNVILKVNKAASKMPQQVKELGTQPHDLSSILETYTEEGEN